MEYSQVGKRMILPDFVLPSRQNQVWEESGLDSLERCIDKKHFLSYTYPIKYNFNSRGFRDQEWPVNLNDAVWCVGDSFTVGIGSPLEHTWVNLLQQKLNQRCINISMDGASNQWIFNKAKTILTEIEPSTLILHWSYTWRAQDPNKSKTDENRRMPFDKNFDDIGKQILIFNNLLEQLTKFKTKTKIIHSFIPKFSQVSRVDMLGLWEQLRGISWPDLPNDQARFDQLDQQWAKELVDFGVYENFKYHYTLYEFYNKLCHVPEFDNVDWARDRHHYDINTAKMFVDNICNLI
jgi:hypothetical protein